VLQKQRQQPLCAERELGYDALILDEVDSTQAHAMRKINEFERPTWILARKQTDARGRRGRKWLEHPGNFAATLILFPKEIQEEQALRSFVASLALFETFVVKTGRESIFSLKWPNDVLLNGGKVAGILLQTVKTIMGRDALLIGVGVNLLIAPKADHLAEQAVNPVALFSETGMKCSPEAFLSTLMKCYARLEYQFQINGFSSIREAWLDKASHLGEIVTARLARQEIVGIFDTIDKKGHLVLQTAGGVKNIAAADVFFRV